jgi:hypothetical protein
MSTEANRRIDGRVLAIGIALIVVANAAALGGAMYNRSGTPDAELVLSERELGVPYNWGRDRDNSGLALRLDWSTVDSAIVDTSELSSLYVPRGRPTWLDSAKLASLGFSMSKPTTTRDGREYYQRQLPKQVLLVMEINGPSYQRAHAQLAARIARADSVAALRVGMPEATRRGAELARQTLLREDSTSTRLFIVDAGLDREALRRQYADRSRYAIVRGSVEPRVTGPDSALTFDAEITELAVAMIHVPRQFHPVFDSVQPVRRPDDNPGSSPFSVTIAFGRRLEPWMTSATRRP